MLGESLGAAGALQAIALVLAMQDGRWPGIAGLEELEPGLPLGAASAATANMEIDLGLVTALGLDGGVCAGALERATS